MPPRRPITDDDDLNLDDIETVPHEGDNGDNLPEDELETDELPEDEDEPVEDEEIAARRREPAEDRQGTTRGARRNQRLANENRDLRERMTALQARFDQFAADENRSRQPAQTAPRETAEQRQQRRALMTDREILEEEVGTMRQELTGTLHQTRRQLSDQADKSSFETLVASDPIARKYASKVEQSLTELRRQGGDGQRLAILKWLIGDAVWEKRGTNGKQRRAAADDRVRRATTRPGNNASDAGGTGGRRARSASQSLEDRLADQPL